MRLRPFYTRFSIKVERKWADLWVGAYWKSKDIHEYDRFDSSVPGKRWDVWICIVPCFPIHLSWRRFERKWY